MRNESGARASTVGHVRADDAPDTAGPRGGPAAMTRGRPRPRRCPRRADRRDDDERPRADSAPLDPVVVALCFLTSVFVLWQVLAPLRPGNEIYLILFLAAC